MNTYYEIHNLVVDNTPINTVFDERSWSRHVVGGH